MASGVIAGGRLGTGVGGAREFAGVNGVLHGDPKNDILFLNFLLPKLNLCADEFSRI